MVGPMTAAGVGADIPGIEFSPPGVTLFRIPDHLRVGTHQDMVAPAFQALTGGSIQNLIIFPFIGNPNHLFLLPLRLILH